MKTVVLVACMVVLATADFANFKVYRVTPTNELQLAAVRKFEDSQGIDFWSNARSVNKEMDIMVSPEAEEQFVNELKRINLSYSVLINNVETVVQQERVTSILAPRIKKGRINFAQYHRYDAIVDYLHQLAEDYPHVVTVSNVGKTTEGRDIAMVKISAVGGDTFTSKPAILIDGGIHAREWIAPASILYFIHQLVEGEGNRALIDAVDWYIVPVLNPDGYEYTHAVNRFWRKTRSPGGRCAGVDANRNFDFHWMEVGASSSECAETYAGPRGFSEPETRTLRLLVEALGDNLKLYLTFHSYGSYILYPWGYTATLPEDWRTLDELAHRVADAIHDVAGTTYTIGSSTNVLYAAAGGSDDWVKAVGGVNLSYTIELPGGGMHGFDPPASTIESIANETWQGVKVFHAYVQKNFA